MTVLFRTFALLAGIALAGCRTETGTMRVDSEVAQSNAALTGPEGATLVLDNGRLVVSRARIAVSEIEFEGGEDEEREAELGAAVIDLDLDGSLTRVTANSVEAGSYHTLGLELAAGGGLGGSLLVEGTYDGNAFGFRSGLSPELEFALRPEVNVPANGEAAVGVLFDVAAWFTAADGAVLNPTDAANQGPIENKIMASMAAHAAIEHGDTD
jgi:hypothetical protein